MSLSLTHISLCSFVVFDSKARSLQLYLNNHVGFSLAHKYQTRVRVRVSDKRRSFNILVYITIAKGLILLPP